MILLLKYNISSTSYLDEILDDSGISYVYSNSESNILSAERIILPEPNDFYSTYKKMNIMNLFSLLRMVKKPILGMNNAVRLMCKQVGNGSKCGMGLFELDSNQINEKEELRWESGILNVSNESKLLSQSFNEKEINFDPAQHSSVSEYSKSYILLGEKKYSLTLERNNYFGVELNFEQNNHMAREIILNFCKI